MEGKMRISRADVVYLAMGATALVSVLAMYMQDSGQQVGTMSTGHQVFVGFIRDLLLASGLIAACVIGIMMALRPRDKERTLQKLRIALINDFNGGKGDLYAVDIHSFSALIRSCNVRALFRAHWRGI
jgi:hypothetical protein